MNEHPDGPVVITSARAGKSAEISRRQVRYLLSMGIRTACFVLAFVVSGPLRWVLVAGAVFLPYVAVVVANASGQRATPPVSPYVPDDTRALDAPPHERT